jgi:hypothetical protein
MGRRRIKPQGDGQAMPVEVLDLILRRLKDAGDNFGQIRAVFGVGQLLPINALRL